MKLNVFFFLSRAYDRAMAVIANVILLSFTWSAFSYASKSYWFLLLGVVLVLVQIRYIVYLIRSYREDKRSLARIRAMRGNLLDQGNGPKT